MKNAMIFAAGLGTRLQPMTNETPKALVTLQGQTLLERTIHLLANQGISNLVINVHHHAEQIVKYVHGQGYFGLNIHFSDERNELLDTGGGLRKAAPWLKDDGHFVAINCDIVTNIDLSKMYQFHLDKKALVTLATRQRPESSRQLLFDDSGLLGGWRDSSKNQEINFKPNETLHPWAFSGVHIIDPEWFNQVTQKGKFSIIDSYLQLGKEYPIAAYPHDSDHWFDVGTANTLAAAERFLAGQ